MKRLFRFLLPPFIMTIGGAVAADNAALVNKAVRVNVSGITAGTVPGKLISQDGCLYVQFDQKTKDGFVSVRLDQVTSLEGRERLPGRDAEARAQEVLRRGQRLGPAPQIKTSLSPLIHRVWRVDSRLPCASKRRIAAKSRPVSASMVLIVV